MTENADHDILPWNIPTAAYLHGFDVTSTPGVAVDADLSGFPPTCVTWGGDEMFRDPIRRYVDRLRAAGVPTDAQEFEGMFHVFQILMPWADDSREVSRHVHSSFSASSPTRRRSPDLDLSGALGLDALTLRPARARRPPCAGRGGSPGGRCRQEVRTLAHGETGELRRAVLGDDDAGVVARRGDHRSLRGDARDAGHDLAVALGRRAQADERMCVEVQLGPGHEVLVPADARDLPAVDAVGHHLAVEIDREGAVDGDEVGVASR